jgi:hypothetical protein
MTRALARVAYGVPWLEEVPPQHIEALLIAAARQVVPGYGTRDNEQAPRAQLIAHYESSLVRALSRRQRKLLEELASHIASPQSPAIQIEAFIGALVRAELRAAFLVTGDLGSIIQELRREDAALHRATQSAAPSALIAVLEHPYAGDVTRFGLTAEATALRRRLGST